MYIQGLQALLLDKFKQLLIAVVTDQLFHHVPSLGHHVLFLRSQNRIFLLF